MRLVLDTNVLVAAFLTRGVCHELVEHGEHAHTLVSSTFILDEFEAKLLDKFDIPPDSARAAAALIESRIERVEPVGLGATVSRDPDDDTVLATALSGRCDCIVTGDRDLLDLEEYAGIVIVSPADFWRFEADQAQ